MVLLHLSHRFLQQSTHQLSLQAIHVNHGISKQSEWWKIFCEEQCKRLGIAFFSEQIDVIQDNDSKQGIESRARTLRYQVFKNVCRENDLLLMGHHRDDQVETLLFRLFRGNGGKALTGIPESRELNAALILRPLLNLDKKELALWASENNLEWIEDESNEDTYFSRNFIRQDILPLIRNRWPQINDALARVGRLQSDQQQLLKEVAQEDFHNLLCKDVELARWGECLDIHALKNLSKARQKNLLRFWMDKKHIQMPPAQRLEKLVAMLNQSTIPSFEIMSWKDDEYTVTWHGFEQQLFLLKQEVLSELEETMLTWKLEEQPCHHFAQTCYCCEKVSATGHSLDKRFSELKVEFREAGLRCQPVGRDKSQLLKKLFQEYRVPPWERDAVPLFFVEEQGEKKLAAVGDLWICKGFEARDGKGWQLFRKKGAAE